ncbi:MAG: hypothetical protein KDK76_05895 [Chlamydiia bacterium]|nr:hypothetical protein [Chlamydiia bacterium]
MGIQALPGQCVRSCAQDLAVPFQEIQESLPQILSEAAQAAGGSIAISLVVDIPKQGDKVPLSELQKRQISIEGIDKDEEGFASIESLAKKNIIIGPEKDLAFWNWDLKEIQISYSSYGDHEEFEKIDYQILNILFEMYNACHTKKFLALRSLNKENYVRAFEKVEWETVWRTASSLETMAKVGRFDPGLNIFKCLYQDEELNYLYQQLNGHSFDIARQYDRLCPSIFNRAYRGTWATPFNETNKVDQIVRDHLVKILNGHLWAIHYDNHSELKKEMAIVQEGVKGKEKWAELVMKNLVFFQKKYQSYVQREKPRVVVHILTLSEPKSLLASLLGN